MRIIVTSIGKRVQLINHLRKKLYVVGVDSSLDNACRNFVDDFYKVPRCDEIDYVNTLKEIAIKNNISAIIPLYEEEFKVLLRREDEFKALDINIILSNNEIINICKSKNETFDYFKDKNINVPLVYSDYEVEAMKKECVNYPLIIKPDDGMGSSSVYKANNIKELEFFKEYIENSIVQEYLDGEEYTVDVLVDFNGKPLYIIPRLRLEVRAGEVTKTKTVQDEDIINETEKVIFELNKIRDNNNKGLVGPLTIQFIKTSEELYLLEINPRFGGGVPLSFEAGADYSSALLKMLNKEEFSVDNEFKELTMLRYDEAVFR